MEAAGGSDESLMAAFRAGDARAFEVLVTRHRQAVFVFILRFVGVRGVAEDLLQETWLKVVRRSPEYEPKALFKTWLYTIARNLCVDHARREKHRQTEALDPEPGADDARPRQLEADPGSRPDRQAQASELRPLLEQALRSLPAEQREVFVLREYSGMAFKEIAFVTGVPENTVKSRMRYALTALRAKLEAAGVDAATLGEERTAAG